MIHEEEFRCTEETAMKIKKQATAAPPLSALEAILGIPIMISEDIPEGKVQFWRDGEMVKEIDV